MMSRHHAVFLLSAAALSLAPMTKLYPAFWICCTITFLASLAIGGARFPVSLRQYLINTILRRSRLTKSSTGLGLVGMQHRVESQGGFLSVHSSGARGTVVSASWSL